MLVQTRKVMYNAEALNTYNSATSHIVMMYIFNNINIRTLYKRYYKF